jgi:hypothetical protein
MSTINLGPVKSIFIQSTPPSNTNVLWRDTSTVPAVLRFFNDSTAVWGPLVLSEEVIFTHSSLNTSGDGSSTGVDIGLKPFSYVHVRIEGYFVDISYGNKTGDAYWSSDSGTTSKEFENLAVGDILYWNGASIAPAELTTNDTVKLYQI